MNALKNKLTSQSGASITYALLLFLVCAVVSSVVLAAGTAAAGRMSQSVESDQRYYSVTSAASLLKKELDGREPTTIAFDIDKDGKRIFNSFNKISGIPKERLKITDYASAVIVKSSYSGGHTKEGNYSKNYDLDKISSDGLFNVIGGRSTGGLVGKSGNALISGSYSTCSAYSSGDVGFYVGGLVGETNGGSISNCYATGYVAKQAEESTPPNDSSTGNNYEKYLTAVGAFAGHVSGAVSLTGDNYYYMIVNERYADAEGFQYLSPIGGTRDNKGIKALDESVTSYQQFIPQVWNDASPYDSTLTKYYHDDDGKPKYNLKSIKQLGGDDTDEEGNKYYISTHYGDWPAPETFVINESGSLSGAGE